MVQFFQAPPSFGSQLANVLGEAAGNIGEGLVRRAETRKANSVFDIIKDPSRSAIEKITAFQTLPERFQKHVSPALAAVLGPQAQMEAEQQQLNQFRQGTGNTGMPNQIVDQGNQQVQAQQPIQQNQNQSNSSDLTNYPEKDLYQMSALSGLPGKLAQQEISRRQQERGREVESFKLTQEYRDNLLKEYEGSKRTLAQLNRLQELSNEGKLTTPLIAKLSESLGVPLSVLSNPQSEEFQKLSQDLMSNITKYYGNRILQVEVDNFLKTIPTLMNSKEGRERVINNMKSLLEPSKIAYDAYKDIRKEEGKIPLDLHERVLERIEPKLDKLVEDFKKNSVDFSIIITPQGYEVKVPRNKVDEAVKAGGILK